MLLVQCICGKVDGLDRSALDHKYQLRLAEPVATHDLVLPPGPGAEILDGARQRVGDEVVEEWPAGGCAERKCLRAEQGATQHGLVQVVPGRQSSSGLAEQQLLCRRWRVDVAAGRAEKSLDLGRGQQAHILHGERSLGAIHDNEARYQRFFGDAAGDKGEVDGLLDVARDEDEPA